MAIREDLVASAVSFLQDPSVANSPIEKRVAFLESKNLTKEEIDASLARAGDPASGTPPVPVQSSGAPVPYNYGRPAPAAPYGQYPAPGYWPQPPPPELPKRDWRDWFIMATVLGGVGYGLTMIAKRYVLPKISPPTPEQLTQDKTAIDASFEKAFGLLDQLTTDTTALKSAEESRTQRLDSALVELESVLSSLKEQDRKREDDARRNADEIRSLRDLIPQALDAQKKTNEDRLKDLGNELKSLKTLVGNRMAAPPPPAQTVSHRPTGSGGNNSIYGSSGALNGTIGTPVNGNAVSPGPISPTKPRDAAAVSPAPAVGGNNPTTNTASTSTGTDAPTPVAEARPVPERSQTSSSFSGRFGSGKAAIPAWQMAAAKKNQESSTNGAGSSSSAAKQDTSESGTVADAGAA